MNGTRIDGKREDCGQTATGQRKEKRATHRLAPATNRILRMLKLQSHPSILYISFA
jgi:hypothetical protein